MRYLFIVIFLFVPVGLIVSGFFLREELAAWSIPGLASDILAFATTCAWDNCWIGAVILGFAFGYMAHELGFVMALGHYVVGAIGFLFVKLGFVVGEMWEGFSILVYVVILLVLAPMLAEMHNHYQGTCGHNHSHGEAKLLNNVWARWKSMAKHGLQLSLDAIIIATGISTAVQFHTNLEIELLQSSGFALFLWVNAWVAWLIGCSVWVLMLFVEKVRHSRKNLSVPDYFPAIGFSIVLFIVTKLAWISAVSLGLRADPMEWLILLVLGIFVAAAVQGLVFVADGLRLRAWGLVDRLSGLRAYALVVIIAFITQLALYQWFVHEQAMSLHAAEELVVGDIFAVLGGEFHAIGLNKVLCAGVLVLLLLDRPKVSACAHNDKPKVAASARC